MKSTRSEHIKQHFETGAAAFDKRVEKIIFHYREMLDALISVLPFKSGKSIKVADLGCGTGTAAYLVKKRFPKAEIECLDLADNMLQLARRKLKGMKNISFHRVNLEDHSFTGKYDAIVSSLALHHIEPGKGKTELYKKIFNALRKGGIFVNADIIKSPNGNVQKVYLNKWAEFISQSFSSEEINLNFKRYKTEDRPADVQKELKALSKIGFKHPEIYWKNYNFVTYGGFK